MGVLKQKLLHFRCLNGKGIELGFKEKSLLSPTSKPIPQATQTLFAYQNEGISPQPVPPFWTPNWHVEFNIQLKTNEALVGRLPRDLRLVALNWQPESNQATIKFYYIGEISAQLEKNYLEIYLCLIFTPATLFPYKKENVMSIQAISNHQVCSQYSPLLEKDKDNKLLQDMGLSLRIPCLRPILFKHEGNRNLTVQLHNQSWSHVDTNDMSKYPTQFAKETWECKCGFKNYIDIWRCPMCGRDRP